ncbi:MAG: hypothetical protein IPQ16_06645 [Geobacteraceae bacterium]|nr:hypothetical protein [Geobacteraceae bacterium]
MSIIDEVRKDREDLARVLKKHTGIRKIVEDLYPDSAHFIYELLQNAEDTGASEACFALSKSALVFEHNGRPFDSKDIYAITDIGEGTKSGDDDKIGRFGVGFKAVFAYSETPHIWCPTFSFKITDLVLPHSITPVPGLGKITRFEFPFNNTKKDKSIAYKEVSDGLKELAETTLLFLTNLDLISWKIEPNISGEILRVKHSNNHFEVLKQSGGKTTNSSHYLKFENPVKGLDKQRVAVAYALEFIGTDQIFVSNKAISKQLKIVSAISGKVSVFFPAEKETSGLRFHLHAPFVPELSRASIKETPANIPLFIELAQLICNSLHEIRELGLLTADFLGVLPNPQDQIPARYECIRKAIVNEMNTKPLTPTHSKSHAPATQLYQCKASLKDLLIESDLKYLIDGSNKVPRWAISAPQKNSNADRFLNGLAITQWDIEDFVELIVSKASDEKQCLPTPPYVLHGPNSDFMKWLLSKSIEWNQQLYALLYKELEPENELYQLEDTNIVKISDGSFSKADKCYFPTDDCKHDDILPRVDINVYTSGKSKIQQANSRKFLEEIGVKEVGEAEQVEAILKQRYSNDSDSPDKKTHIKDINRFISLLDNEPNKAHMFKDYYIFHGNDDEWYQPNDFYLDSPFVSTGLSRYYDAIGDASSIIPLNKSYSKCGIDLNKFVIFAKAVGVHYSIQITKASCYQNPKVTYLVWQAPGRASTYEHNEDYQIDSIVKVIRNKSIDISRLIWKTISSSTKSWTKARYCKNYSQPYRYAPSQLAVILTNNEWIPQDNGQFVRPKDVSVKSLPKGFPIDKGWDWLKDIGFCENELKKEQELARLSEESRQRESLAKELGFDDENTLARALRFVSSLSSDEQDAILDEFERRKNQEFPERHSPDPERRADKVKKQAENDLEKTTDKRSRSVPIGLEDVKKEAEQYLRHQYTNSDGIMFCQICNNSLPFKLDNENFYFEKVEFISEINTRHHQNYLALCPNHSAMFKHVNNSKDLQFDMFKELESNELEIVLAQTDMIIHFTTDHRCDLQTIFEQPDANEEYIMIDDDPS